MNYKILMALLIGAGTLCTSCATTVETTMTKNWEKELALDNPQDLEQMEMHLTGEGNEVTLVYPSGMETLDAKGETIYEIDRKKFFRTYIHTTRGAEEITDKISYLPLPHRNSVLEFNYSMTAESVTMIDLDSREISWMNEDLKWSHERYQVFARSAAKGLSALNQSTVDVASEVLLADRFVKNMTKIVPELDAMLFKTLDGLKLISLETGEVLWNNEEVKGGIAKMFYDDESNSLLVVNRDDDAFKVQGLQFNKQIARVDAEDGSTIWLNRYDGDIREKLNGIGIWADREADIRLLDDVVMINFLNVEIFDFNSGNKLWQTSEGANRLLDMVAADAQIMNLFAFPVIEEGNLFRVGFENVGLTGVDVIIEAYDLYTGEQIWKSSKLSRSKPVNNMEVADDLLVLTMGSSEGIIALDLTSGEAVWSYDGLGGDGVQYPLYKTSKGILAAGKDKVTLLDTKTGGEQYSITTKQKEPGDIQDVFYKNNEIFISGSKGFAVYDAESGSMKKSIVTPTGGILTDGSDRLLMSPKPNYADAVYPVDGAFYILDPKGGKLLGTLGTDGNRRNWIIDNDFKYMYVLTGNKIARYQAQ